MKYKKTKLRSRVSLLAAVCLLSLSSVSAWAANEVWVCIRDGSAVGAGTVTDPYNGSTQAGLDAAMQAAYYNSNTIVNFAKGNYTSNAAWGVSDGCKIRGAGKADTKFTFTGSLPGPRFTAFDCNGNDIEVSNLSIVFPAAATVTTAGVSIRGNRGIIRNVQVTNPHSSSVTSNGTVTDFQCFAICILSGANSVIDALIEGCEVNNFIGSSGTMISIGSDSTNTETTVTGVVRNCSVHDCTTAIAYGSAGTLNALFQNNYANDCLCGFDRQAFRSNGDQLLNNRFLNCAQYGMIIVSTSPAIGDFIVDGNVCSMNKLSPAGAIFGFYISGTINGIIIRNNIASFDGPDISGTSVAQYGFNVIATSNVIAENNLSSSVLRNQFTASSNPPLLLNNASLNGGYMYTDDYSLAQRTPIVQMFGPADPGWAADTGISSKVSHNTEGVSTKGNAQSIKAIKDALIAHGIIGP